MELTEDKLSAYLTGENPIDIARILSKTFLFCRLFSRILVTPPAHGVELGRKTLFPTNSFFSHRRSQCHAILNAVVEFLFQQISMYDFHD